MKYVTVIENFYTDKIHKNRSDFEKKLKRINSTPEYKIINFNLNMIRIPYHYELRNLHEKPTLIRK